MLTKLSTSVEMKVFMILHLLFGNYFKVFLSKTASTVLRFYCCCITVPILIVCSVTLHSTHFPMHSSWTNVFEFIISFIMSQLTSQKILISFTNLLNTLDGIMGFKTKSNKLNKTFFILLIINILLNIRAAILVLPELIGTSSKSFVVPICFVFLWIATQLRYCKVGIVISLMHHRLKLLRKHLEKNDIPINIIGSEDINKRVYVVRKGLIYYDNLLDAFDGIDYYMQMEVVLISVFYLIKVFSYFYHGVISYLDNEYTVYFGYNSMMNMTLDMCMAFSSFVMMLFCNNEIDQIKKKLVIQIISCSDVSLREELENLLQHVTRRPFRFTLLRAVPVDLYLCINIISMAITYVIIFLQFTHFGHSFRT